MSGLCWRTTAFLQTGGRKPPGKSVQGDPPVSAVFEVARSRMLILSCDLIPVGIRPLANQSCPLPRQCASRTDPAQPVRALFLSPLSLSLTSALADLLSPFVHLWVKGLIRARACLGFADCDWVTTSASTPPYCRRQRTGLPHSGCPT